MKCILSSSGFTTKEIIAKTEELTNKSRDTINIAVINECYAVEHENNLRWVLDDLNNIRKNFGGNLELVNILALDESTIKERIEFNDCIFVVGGHTDYLMKLWNKTGFSLMLQDFLQRKVYIGSSAGSMVMGKRLSSEAYEAIYGEKGSYGITSYLEFVDVTIMPHLDSPHFPNRKEHLLKVIKKNSFNIYGLRDDSAYIVDGNQQYTIGSKPLIINDAV